VSLACRARLDSEGCWREVRLAAGSVAPIPFSLGRTEAFLEGRRPSRDAVTKAIGIAESEIRPIDDIRSTETYRRTIAGRLLRRFLEGFLE
jgi:carbon-monoxide dehydrogenase medium subunit